MAAARAAFIVGFAFGRTKHIGPHCAGLMRELVGLSSGLILAALVSTAAWMLGSYGVRFGCAP
jgi:hypothetical protein